MEKITRNNYEAYFLDYMEGNLNDEMRLAVEGFIAQNPDLAEELEAFDLIEVKPEGSAQDWSGLKRPEETSLEELFFKSVEGTLNASEQKELDGQLQNEAVAKDFEFWKKTKLTPNPTEVSKDDLYNLSLVMPIGDHNYEHFLIARAEGLLRAEQETALQAYAALQSAGERDLLISERIQLKAPTGIFYPDKDKLYKKERKGLVLFYRAAAVAAILMLGGWWFANRQNVGDEPRLAEQEKVQPVQVIDSVQVEEGAQDTLTEQEEAVVPLEEWEMREPDPVFIAEESPAEPVKESAPKIEPTIEIEETPVGMAEQMESPEKEPVELEEAPEDVVPFVVDPIDPAQGEDMAQTESETTPADEYKSLPEITEDVLASTLNIPDEERDRMALAIAKRVTEKAAEVLDSEVSAEESEERMTYTLRIKKFKIQHSRKR